MNIQDVRMLIKNDDGLHEVLARGDLMKTLAKIAMLSGELEPIDSMTLPDGLEISSFEDDQINVFGKTLSRQGMIDTYNYLKQEIIRVQSRDAYKVGPGYLET